MSMEWMHVVDPDRKTKKEMSIKRPTREKNPDQRIEKKDTLGQPINTTGGRTLSTSGVAQVAIMKIVRPGAARCESGGWVLDRG